MQDTPGSSRTCATRGWTIFLIIWILFIWGHSLIPGVDSSAESGRFVRLFHDVFVAFGVTETSMMSFIVRKAAHFSEYFILGATARALFSTISQECRARFAVLLVALVPVIDETIQLFTPDRSGQVTDVLLDLSGVAVGALVCFAIQNIGRRLKTARGRYV